MIVRAGWWSGLDRAPGFLLRASALLLVAETQDAVDVLRLEAGFEEQDEGVVPEVVRLGRQHLRGAILGGDDHLGGLLADLAPDPVDAGGEEMVGIRALPADGLAKDLD